MKWNGQNVCLRLFFFSFAYLRLAKVLLCYTVLCIVLYTIGVTKLIANCLQDT